MRCKSGDAKLTVGGDLKAKYVAHAAGKGTTQVAFALVCFIIRCTLPSSAERCSLRPLRRAKTIV